MEKEKEKQRKELIMKYCYNSEPLEEIFSYWDFVWWRERYRLEPVYERSSIKLPAFGVRSAIILFMTAHIEHVAFPTVWEKELKKFEGRIIETTFFQIIEYKLVKTRGYTSHQYKQVKIWNRHDFLPEFKMRYIIE